ncbi:MAG: AMP-binding protein [Lentisphaeria bacterium]
MSLLSRFVNRTEFNSYEDFYKNFKLELPEHFNFTYDVVDVYAKEEPDRVALVWCNDYNEEQVITFKDLAQRTNRVANMFLKQGIGRGDKVILIMKSRHEFWPCILAIHKIGAIVIPATHMLKDRDLVYRIKKGKIKALVAIDTRDLLQQIDEAQEETGDILKFKFSVGVKRDGWLSYEEEFNASSPEFTPVKRELRNKNTDAMLIYFTSGTSGFPKMVAHNFTYAAAHIMTGKYWLCGRENELHYTVADTGWGKAVWGKLYGQWLAGAQVFVYDYDKFSADNMLKKLISHKVSTFCAPPTIYRFLIKEDLTKYDLSCLHYTCVAGEPLNPSVYNTFKEKTGLELKEAYGQTELVVSVANWPWITPKPGSMGKPSPGYHIDLLDAEGHKVEIGEEGEMCLQVDKELPPGIFIDYHDDKEMTDSAWHDGYYHTGDVAWCDEDGYFWFVGRADDVIKSSGYRIGPFEVESVLMQHPAVMECAITGAPDPVRGQIIKATIVLTNGFTPSEELKTEIQKFVKSHTAPYKYPRLVEFIKEMPKTISGKIRRTAIRHGN